jgi:hypothetical protein
MGYRGGLCPLLHLQVRLNHRDLLSTVWSWAGVPMADRQSVAQLLAIMGTWPPRAAARKSQWPLIRRQLLQVGTAPKQTLLPTCYKDWLAMSYCATSPLALALICMSQMQ